MHSCKLGSLALLLALSASHHFILLQCFEPSADPFLTPDANKPKYVHPFLTPNANKSPFVSPYPKPHAYKSPFVNPYSKPYAYKSPFVNPYSKPDVNMSPFVKPFWPRNAITPLSCCRTPWHTPPPMPTPSTAPEPMTTPEFEGPPPRPPPPPPSPGNAPEPTESDYGSPYPNTATEPMTTPEFEGPPPRPPPPPPSPGNAREPTESDYGSPSPPPPTPKSASALTTREPTLVHDLPKTEAPTGLIAGAVIGSVGLIVGLFACFFIWRKRRTRQSAQPQPPKANEEAAPSYASVALRLGPTGFTYEELESATNAFSDSNFLGEGGYGVVHKGVHPYNKQTYVAIKQLKYGIQQAHREFLNETAIISRVHHKHLVSLVGYCMDEARSKMMLVYDFVSNNTLAFHLHGTETIDWKTRMKIAIGSAKGLAYLHEECHPKIIHRDIKATNILLDDNFEPKVADFGLAKFSLESQVMTRIMGSFGYLAPEYVASGNLTEKADVFSFGVVLLELITGRKPVGDTETFPNGSMVEWARHLFSEALDSRHFEGIADERLENDYDVEEMFRMISCAANCVRHSATNRPPMTQVVKALEGEIWLENDMTAESPARRQLSEDMNKMRKIAMGSYSTTHSDQLHFSTSTSTSSSGSNIFR